MNSSTRIIILGLLILIGALFLIDFGPSTKQKVARNVAIPASAPGVTNTLAPPKIKVKTPVEGEPDFTLSELLSLPNLDAENEQDSLDGEPEIERALAQTVRAASGKGNTRTSYGSDTGTDSETISGYESVSPELEALREIEQLALLNNSSFLGGARVSNPIGPEVTDGDVATEPIPTATPTTELERVSGQARGYTMLYLMHPNARRTVEEQVNILLRSQVNDLYLGVLVDGTFSRDFAYLSDVLRRLSRVNRSVTLVLYLTNGSTMRIHTKNISDAGFNNINPTEFRSLIRFDSDTRDKFVRLIRPVVPVLQLNTRLSNRSRNFVIVMLEDNLDDDSYLAMRRLADNVIGTRASFIRNPCPGCWEGNTSNTFGDALELHTPADIESLSTRDGFSLDGVGYRLPGEDGVGGLPFGDARQLALTAAARGIRYFGLWRFERQGLTPNSPVIPPDERTYEVPNEQAATAEIELLRAGLRAID